MHLGQERAQSEQETSDGIELTYICPERLLRYNILGNEVLGELCEFLHLIVGNGDRN